METFSFYSGKVIVISGVMFLYYRLFLKDKTFHHYNRFYLLAVMLVSLLLPLLKVSYFTVEVNNDIYLLINKLKNSNSNTSGYDFSYFRIIAVGFGLVSVFFLTRFAIGIAKISRLKNRFPKEKIEGINFYRTNLDNAPFSYFRNLFWKNSILIQSDLGKQILKHEMVHIEQKHTFDKILIEIIKSVFWFNPFFYLIHKEIHLIHEYLADKKAVKQSDTKAFAQMLLASHFSGEMLPATSPFLSSNLKKRLKMLKKPKTKFSYARRIFALPLVFAIAFAYLVNAKNKEIKAANIEIAKAVEQIKKDTVIAKAVPIPEAEIPSKISKSFEDHNKKIADLSNEIAKKSSDLKNLKHDSKEFSAKVDEINSLSGKINEIANSDDFKKNITIYRFNDAISNPEMLMKFDTDSKEFKDLMSKNKEYFNSDEWKNTVKELAEIKFVTPPDPQLPPNIAYGFDGTDIFTKHPELFFKSEKDAKEAFAKARTIKGKAQLSAKDAKKIEKLAKKQAELAKKQAELAAEQAKINGNNRKIIVMNNKFPKVMEMKGNGFYFNSKNIENSKISGNIKYYINGKEVGKSEVDKLNSEDIDHINVNKNNKDGKESGEIRITTKK